MNKLQRILVATDFSETADAALDEALVLATRTGAKVTIVHVWQIPIYGLPDGSIVASAQMVTEILDGADDALEALVARCRDRGYDVTSELVQGPPEEKIRDLAVRLGADLVVLGTHGRRGISHAFLGSVAEKVVRTCPVPVLTVSSRAVASGAAVAAAPA